mmetsp:Transcript_109790/g.236221  ORF Transcript_109790/g.236221 Transcript_109790/m.236221 type:complete len:266 (+) Transcript_109790:1798-2595(+)
MIEARAVDRLLERVVCGLEAAEGDRVVRLRPGRGALQDALGVRLGAAGAQRAEDGEADDAGHAVVEQARGEGVEVALCVRGQARHVHGCPDPAQLPQPRRRPACLGGRPQSRVRLLPQDRQRGDRPRRCLGRLLQGGHSSRRSPSPARRRRRGRGPPAWPSRLQDGVGCSGGAPVGAGDQHALLEELHVLAPLPHLRLGAPEDGHPGRQAGGEVGTCDAAGGVDDGGPGRRDTERPRGRGNQGRLAADPHGAPQVAARRGPGTCR